jgi:septin family protein
MTSGQASALKVAVEARKNILVAGGTSSGKTTLTNALLAEVAKMSDRVVLIEDTRESVEDDKLDPGAATQAARRLVDNEGVYAQVGSASLLECTANANFYRSETFIPVKAQVSIRLASRRQISPQ